MSWDNGLSGVAKRIAASEQSPIRVIAGPGTGKSLVLKRRVARLLQIGSNPSDILALTFTRNAAANLVEDLKELGTERSGDIRVGTLHSYCYSLLLKREVLERTGRYPRPLLSFRKNAVLQYEAAPLLQDIIRVTKHGTKRDATRTVDAFEAAWARLQSQDPGWPESERDRVFHDTLIAWLRFHRAILIGELVPLALEYLRNNPACLEMTAFKHVLVDEYQDLNKADQVLIDLLSASSNKFIVGDPDQSIYSFRFANPTGITTFGDTHPGTHDEQLVYCRRCPTRVVELADRLIRHNYGVSEPPRLRPYGANPSGDVSIVQWKTLEQEA